MQPFIILHTNDIHGRIEGLARITTMIDQVRLAHPTIPVLYFDIGDIEENTVRVSNLTKGVAMYRLLNASGCDAVLLLSHLGLEVDRALAVDLQDDVALIIGAHSHHLLPEGERVGRILIAQAGEYAQNLGRLDLAWDGVQLVVQAVSILPVSSATQPASRILDEVVAIEAETEQYLQDNIGELVEPLEYASDLECGTANLMADMLREHMGADLAIITPGVSFIGPLPAGPLRRVTLWDVCNSPANPGVVTMTGVQLLAVVQRGLDPIFAQDRPRPMRGLARGLMHFSGARMQGGQLLVGGLPVEPQRLYQVAGSDWELEPYGGYVEQAWNLQPRFAMPTILREALEAYLATHSPLQVEMGRLG